MTPAYSIRELSSQIPVSLRDALQALGNVVAPEATAALYAPLGESEPYAGVVVQRDLHYGPDARHLLDVFRPENAIRPAITLVFVHGGAFTRGDRRLGVSPFNDNIALWAARQGWTGVNMTYRLAPQYAWPSAQHDIALALQWLRANAGVHGVDRSKIVLMGHSAGAAHVAQYLACRQCQPPDGPGIAGAVMLSGIYDPATAENNPPLRAYFGEDASRFAARSAVGGLIASEVPQIFAVAGHDPADFVSQASVIEGALRDAAKPAEIYRLAGHSHMSEIFSINTADTAWTHVLRNRIADWCAGVA